MIPEKVKEVLKTLKDAGYEAYIVGGAVRDYVLGKEPKDWDITTNALPEQVKSLFKRTIDTGLQHGTVTAMLGKEGFEITTYRIDGDYSDGRHPDSVLFASRLEDDLSRRDLTFNAMAMDENENIIDPFNGQEDLKNKIIRTVGNAKDRFSEDALRMMRAVRFGAKLGFDLSAEVVETIKELAPSIKNISQERITSEMNQIMRYKPEDILVLQELGLTKHFFKELDFAVKKHGLEQIKNTLSQMQYRKEAWGELFHFITQDTERNIQTNDLYLTSPKPIVMAEISKDIMSRLIFPNTDKEYIGKLITFHDLVLTEDYKIRRFASTYNDRIIENLKHIQTVHANLKNQSTKAIEYMYNKIDEVKKDKTAITLKDLAVNGQDLIKEGFKGKEIGEKLEEMYVHVLKNPEHNIKDFLLNKFIDRTPEIKRDDREI